MLRKYTFQLTQYTYDSQTFNGNLSNMWSPGNVLINCEAKKIELLNFIYWITIGQYMLSLGIILGSLKNIINFDLEALSFNLLLWSQVIILEISLLMLFSISVGLLVLPNVPSVETKVVLSAYIIRSNFLVAALIRILNRRGPITEPWGIPREIPWSWDFLFPSCTYCSLSDR